MVACGRSGSYQCSASIGDCLLQQWNSDFVLDARAILGEGPSWLEDRRALLWVDIDSCLVCMFDPESGSNQTWQLPSHVSAVVPTIHGDFLAATQRGIVRLNTDSGQITPLIHPEADVTGNRFNDGKCDPQGRFWIGSISYQRTPESASLYCIDSQLGCRKVVTKVTTSNGLTWSSDQKTFYYIDTPTRRVDAFDFNGETGELSNRRTIIRIPEAMGKPDGMTIDRDGMLWVALWAGWGVSRWNPSTGECIGKVNVPAERTSSCAFGGDDYDTLFITTARTGLDEFALLNQPLAGGLFAVKTGCRGVPGYRFAG